MIATHALSQSDVDEPLQARCSLAPQHVDYVVPSSAKFGDRLLPSALSWSQQQTLDIFRFFSWATLLRIAYCEEHQLWGCSSHRFQSSQIARHCWWCRRWGACICQSQSRRSVLSCFAFSSAKKAEMFGFACALRRQAVDFRNLDRSGRVGLGCCQIRTSRRFFSLVLCF